MSYKMSVLIPQKDYHRLLEIKQSVLSKDARTKILLNEKLHPDLKMRLAEQASHLNPQLKLSETNQSDFIRTHQSTSTEENHESIDQEPMITDDSYENILNETTIPTNNDNSLLINGNDTSKQDQEDLSSDEDPYKTTNEDFIFSAPINLRNIHTEKETSTPIKKIFLRETSPINISPIRSKENYPIHDNKKQKVDLKNNTINNIDNQKDINGTISEKNIPTTPQDDVEGFSSNETNIHRRTRSSTRKRQVTKRNRSPHFIGPKTRTQTKKSAEQALLVQKGKGIRSSISWIVY